MSRTLRPQRSALAPGARVQVVCVRVFLFVIAIFTDARGAVIVRNLQDATCLPPSPSLRRCGVWIRVRACDRALRVIHALARCRRGRAVGNLAPQRRVRLDLLGASRLRRWRQQAERLQGGGAQRPRLHVQQPRCRCFTPLLGREGLHRWCRTSEVHVAKS